MDAGWDESVVMDKAILGTLIENDVEFDPDDDKDSRISHFSRLITEEITESSASSRSSTTTASACPGASRRPDEAP